MRSFVGDSGRTWKYDETSALGAAGGFGQVFLGSEDVGAPVAVKVIPSLNRFGQLVPDRLRDREAEIVRKLAENVDSADHLVRVFDVAADQEQAYIVMEVASGSLADAMALGGVGREEAIAVLLEVAIGLQQLHAQAVIHRDLKPANILGIGDKWKLADFGIARDSDVGTQTLTFVGSGTPPYMAPELWENRSPTIKSDLYALGCIGYELVVSHPPFEAETPEEYCPLHREQAPAPLPNGTNPALEAIILRMLSKEPEARQQDARAVVERLARVAQPLSPVQVALQTAATQHSREVAEEEARKAGEKAARDRAAALQTQAEADLREICEEAHVLIQAALPEVTYGFFLAKQCSFKAPLGDLTLELVEASRPPSIQGDSLVATATVTGRNRSGASAVMATAVYEEVAGRLCWQLYRFNALGLLRPGAYTLGPPDGPHGFAPEVFARERPHMLSQAMHVFQTTRVPLDPEVIVELYSEALTMRRGPTR